MCVKYVYIFPFSKRNSNNAELELYNEMPQGETKLGRRWWNRGCSTHKSVISHWKKCVYTKHNISWYIFGSVFQRCLYLLIHFTAVLCVHSELRRPGMVWLPIGFAQHTCSISHLAVFGCVSVTLASCYARICSIWASQLHFAVFCVLLAIEEMFQYAKV